MVKRRSSGSLGRIEIRSSSADSQFIIFKNKSRLPASRKYVFATQLDEPTTTNRPPPPSLPELYVPAAPSTNGPFLSEEDCLISAAARLFVAKESSVDS